VTAGSGPAVSPDGTVTTRDVSGVGVAIGPGAHSTVTLIDSQVTLAMPTAAPVVPAQLPADTPLFTGRDSIQRDVEAMLERAATDTPNAVPVAAFTGKGGVGKTALAVHLAHALRPRYSDGQLYMDLRGAESDPAKPGDVLASFLAALGFDRSIPNSTEERRRMYLSALSARRVLVLLDNAADEAQVRPLLPGGAGCLALVTSRRWLAALETAHVVPLDILDPSAAMTLLGTLIGTDRVDREPGAAAGIAGLCGYLPLALCIAGGRLAARPHWPLSRLAERLADEHRRLDELAVGDRAVRASFNLSYQGLEPAGRRVFRLLGLIETVDFPAWVAAALLGVDTDEAEGALERLVEFQLLEPAGSAEALLPRYRFHDLVRVFARETVAEEEPESNRLAAVESMVGEYVAIGELAWAMEPDADPERRPPEQAARWAAQHLGTVATAPPGGVDWFRAERDGFVTVQYQAYRAGLWEPTWRIAELLAQFFIRYAHGSESEVTKELALDATRQAGDRRAEAAALRQSSELYLNRAAWDQAVDVLRQALDIYVEMGDRAGEFQTLLFIGVVRRDQGHFTEAISSFRRCLAMSDEVGQLEVAATQFNIGFALREQGFWDDARTAFESGLAVFQATGDSLAQARILYGLAVVHAYQRRLDDALRMLVDAERLARISVDARWVTIIRLGQGRVRCHQGEWQEGVSLFEQCLTSFVEIGDRIGEAHTLRSLGIALRTQGFGRDAMACLRRGLEVFTALGDTRSEARIRHSIGTVHQLHGEYDAARNSLVASLVLSRAIDDRPWQARTLNRLGLLAAAQQDLTTAGDNWAEADRALDGLQAATLAAALRRSRLER
jgi:tetratricopeptide (TPR) repeat protein